DLMAGNYGVNTTPAARLDSDSYLINYGLRISGWKTVVPEVVNMSLTGPEGNPHPDIFNRGYNYHDNCECFNAFFMRQQLENQELPVELPFSKGIYTFSLDGIHFFTLEYASINAKYFLLLAEPVIITNQEGKVTRVEIEYMLPDGSPVDQSKFITTLCLQFHNESNLLYQEGSMFDLMNILPDFENVDITGNVDLQTITNLSVIYTDLVGNMYSIDWKKP
ncbi:MAG: hypothetical protein IH594_02125, partial [Bacteroidales bacterium]|nr:hypothetical protein [Bacteroidales bacterium]